VIFPTLHQFVKSWSDNERVTFCNITRYFDFLQHVDAIAQTVSRFPIVNIRKSPSVLEVSIRPPTQSVGETKGLLKAVSTSKSVSEPSRQSSSQKEEGKQPVTSEEQRPLDVSRLDIRVGKILTCKRHESADSLYVETIDVGELKPRQVVSGLVNFLTVEEMEGADVILLCNLKPSKLRGITSEAMVLAASDAGHTRVELVSPPLGSKVGERVYFEGYLGLPDKELNPKHKIFEQIQPDLHSLSDCIAAYRDSPFTTSAGPCRVKSIKNGSIK